ncbi:hypothetical protein [Longispora albida]|uniref:hypothetical protein n=1 Tax=Longispora albida TaxID=203523 RepID=UPI00036E7499|nr:hypothetical protein [Longispora albida]
MVRMAIAGTMIMFAGLLMAGLSGYDLGVARAARALRVGVATARAAGGRSTVPGAGASTVALGTAGRPHLGTGPLAVSAVALGLLLATAGAGGVVWSVPVTPLWHWVLVAGSGALVLLAGLLGVTKLVRRVEISAYAKGAALLPVLVPGMPGMPQVPVQPQVAGTPQVYGTPQVNGTSQADPVMAAGAAGAVLYDPAVPEDAQLGWVYLDAAGTWLVVVAAEDCAGRRFVRLTDFRLMPIGLVQLPVSAAGAVELAVWPLDEAGPEAAEERD